MQLTSYLLGLVGYELYPVTKDVTRSNGLFRGVLCGPRAALTQHHHEYSKVMCKVQNRPWNKGNQFAIFKTPNIAAVPMTPDEQAKYLLQTLHMQCHQWMYTLQPWKQGSMPAYHGFPASIMCYFDKQTQLVIQKLSPGLLIIFGIDFM